MPRTRRKRKVDALFTDGWSSDENWTFVSLMQQEAKSKDLKDVKVLTEACQMIAATLTDRFRRRFSFQSMKIKLEQMRKRHKLFDEFLETPGVLYDIAKEQTIVDRKYWQCVSAKDEPDAFRHFREKGEPLHLLLSFLFDEDKVGSFPRDLTGSPQCPIDVRDSDEDELALVPVGEGGVVNPIPFDESNEIVPLVRHVASVSGSAVVVGGGMFGEGLWEVD